MSRSPSHAHIAPENDPSSPSSAGRSLRQALCLAETWFLLGGMSVVAAALARFVGLPTRRERDAFLTGVGEVDWLGAAAAESTWLFLRYGLTFGAILLIIWAVGRPSRREAYLTRNGQSFTQLVATGVAVCLIAVAPVQLVHLINHFFPFGGGTLAWNAFGRSSWTWEFWLFMAASSFVLVAIVEELFFRSYVLARYRLEFSDGAALVLVSVLFWIAHGQYLRPDAFLLANSVAVLIGSFALGWVTLATGSLIPALAMHMLFNIPLTVEGRIAWLAAAAALLIARHDAVGRALASFASMLRNVREWRFLALAALTLILVTWLVRSAPALLPAVGLGFAALAAASVTMQIRERRRQARRA